MYRPTHKVLLSWSTGKDSAYTLYKLQQLSEFEIVGVLTTVTKKFARTNMHGVRRNLLEEQIKRLGVSPYILELPFPCSDKDYEVIMQDFLATQVKAANISHVAFGDLFLENIRNYRETKLATTSIKPIFPLWQQDTKLLAHEIIAAGFKAIVTCIDPKKLDVSFVGRTFDNDFLNDLPEGIDPCGEHGEFHTFVYDAPIFSKPIDISVGAIVQHDSFTFADIMLTSN